MSDASMAPGGGEAQAPPLELDRRRIVCRGSRRTREMGADLQFISYAMNVGAITMNERLVFIDLRRTSRLDVAEAQGSEPP